MSWNDRPGMSPGHKGNGDDWEKILDQIDSLTAPGWTSYTPVLGGDGGVAPVLNNGTLVGAYRKSVGGDIVFAQITLTMGSTTTFGSGGSLYTLTLPPIAANANDSLVGVAQLFDSGTIRRPGCTIKRTTTEIYVVSDAGVVAPTVPFTWAANDIINIDIWYRCD